MNFIKAGNLIINPLQLIDADFEPAKSGTDEETGKPFNRTAQLTLRFAGPTSEPHYDFQGGYTGHDDHSPYMRILRGKDAEAIWRNLCGGAGEPESVADAYRAARCK